MYRFKAFMWRDFTRWSRLPLSIISSMIMPATLLLFMGLVLPVEYDGNYLDYVTPGIMVLSMMTASLAAGSVMMSDKVLGYLNKYLALPAPRESILLGKMSYVLVRGILQSTVILIMSLLVGATPLSIQSYVGMYAILILFSLSISALGATVSLYMKDQESYTAFQAFFSMPLYFASSAMIPVDEMPDLLRYVAEVNPMTYAMEGIRTLSNGDIPWVSIIFLSVVAVFFFIICSYKFRKVTIG